MAYSEWSKPKVAAIMNESPFLQFDIEVEFTVFSPSEGSILCKMV